jgi:hypothetical protein
MRKRSEAGSQEVSRDPAPGQEATGDLARALEEGAQRDAEPRLDPRKWESANAAEGAEVSPGFQRIVESVYVDDVKAAYDRLEAELEVGDARTDYGTVMQHLDRAERNARMAHRLWQTAIVEFKRWELDNEVVSSGMRLEATRSLQREKESGLRAKQITDADVESRVADLFPDEWRSQQWQRNRLKGMVASMENLSEVWLSRCRTLNTILSKQR